MIISCKFFEATMGDERLTFHEDLMEATVGPWERVDTWPVQHGRSQGTQLLLACGLAQPTYVVQSVRVF